jgi:predicted nucleic acid-binding protein
MAERLLLDTNILIDLLRQRSPAISYIQALAQAPFTSTIVIAELYGGVRDGAERGQLDDLTRNGIRVVPLTAEMGMIAGLFMRQYAKSHSVGLADALIAATTQQIKARLVTLNIKHFPMLTDAIVPYKNP